MAIQDMFKSQSNPMSGQNLWNTGLGIYDYYKGRDTASDAAKNLSKGYTAGQNELHKALDPWAMRGNQAADTYMNLAGQYPSDALNLPDFDPSQLRDMDYLRNTPGYQFRYDEGAKARENAAAARGLNLSTNIVRDMEKYGQDMASQEYEKEYDRLRDMYGIERSNVMDEYTAGRQDYQNQMQNYVPLMNAGFNAAGTIGTGAAQLEVARGGAAATREQNQGSLQSDFLNNITTGGNSMQNFAEQLGIDDWSFADIGNTFGDMRDWFNDPNTSFAGSWDDFWGGVRDFEIGDLFSLFD
jgi:hypothetical protein